MERAERRAAAALLPVWFGFGLVWWRECLWWCVLEPFFVCFSLCVLVFFFGGGVKRERGLAWLVVMDDICIIYMYIILYYKLHTKNISK